MVLVTQTEDLTVEDDGIDRLPLQQDALAILRALYETDAIFTNYPSSRLTLHDTPVPPPTIVPELKLLHRVSFGLAPNDATEFAEYDPSNASRFESYVLEQLAPETIDDSACDAALIAADLPTLTKSTKALWLEHLKSPEILTVLQPLAELFTVKIMRAVQSKRQIQERLVEFWFDHFNIYSGIFPAYTMLMVYDRDVIRPNVLGNFRTLLGAVAHSTCMLHYLDNVRNFAAGPNENYARELLELHTLGIGAFNQPDGYNDTDVVEVARCFTGWTTLHNPYVPEENTGEFYFNPSYHDNDVKYVMGSTILDGGKQDAEHVLDILAAHPATAHHIATKLCRYFIQDAPLDALIEVAAQKFLDAQAAPDQMAQVLEVILLSPEFRSGTKFKRPFETLISALRVMGSDFVPRIFHDTASYVLYFFLDTSGHLPFGWHPPNGYPDVQAAWQTTSSLVIRWRAVNWMTTYRHANGQPLLNIMGQHPATENTATKICDYWIARVFGYPLTSETRQRLIAFMAQHYAPDAPLPFADTAIQARLKALVALLFMLPEFQVK